MISKVFSFQLRFWSACLGNLFEHYDTALFAFLSPFLAPWIFPEQDPILALVFTYAMIPLGMMARPFGSLVFGHFGDLYGRKKALSWSLGGMAIVSGCIAFTPLYVEAGIFSPIFFCLGRISQNFFAAGEIMGGSIFLLENAPEKKRDLLSSLYNASTIAGILLASFGVSLFSCLGSLEWGWRALYLLGCTTALFGFLIRSQDTQELAISSDSPKLIDQWTALWKCRKALLIIMLMAGFGYANYAMALVLVNGFLPLISSFSEEQMVSLNTILLVLDFCTLPLFGWLSSKVSREKMMLVSAVLISLTSIPLFMLLEGASFLAIVCIRTLFVIYGVAFFAPFHAWAIELVPARNRYAVISLGYALGSQLLGGPTAAISLWVYQLTGWSWSISGYWVLLALMSSFVLMKKQAKQPKLEELGVKSF